MRSINELTMYVENMGYNVIKTDEPSQLAVVNIHGFNTVFDIEQDEETYRSNLIITCQISRLGNIDLEDDGLTLWMKCLIQNKVINPFAFTIFESDNPDDAFLALVDRVSLSHFTVQELQDEIDDLLKALTISAPFLKEHLRN